MIKGIGIDIVELDRIKRLLYKNDRFQKRILTDNELDMMKRYSEKRKVEFIAGRFAAKEAFGKAMGTGISGNYGFQDIEVVANRSGKPSILAVGIEEIIHVSISHSEEYAVAQVVLES
ncbi:holo-ACP synthase [Salibacterium salarium]|uniref:Holo-[acyl-carrier-protein] synthase n=1 Tax=Salibacterium salarium TaxID=284579 RepID=A0A3R9WMB9_9BACI|nr:holo-ACP synthase [Salibacterium salarium]RSL29426.1 holo-ACP synthase [Salibacterium salarium]